MPALARLTHQTSMRTPRIAALTILMTLPGVAWASDYTGVFSMLYLIFVVTPLALAYLVVMVISTAKSRYRSRDYAIKHSKIATIATAIGAVLAIFEFRNVYIDHRGDATMMTAIYGSLLIASWIPMAIHTLHRVEDWWQQ